MDPQHLPIGEIRRNRDLAFLAFSDMEKHLQSIKASDKETLDRVWLSVTSFLTVVANISKILWPSEPYNKTREWTEVSSRREALRVLLSIDASSIIARRTFRNYFEHYDFRIEEAAKSNIPLIIDSNILPIGLLQGIESNPMARMRNFDPQTFILCFREDQYPLKEAVKAIRELSERIKAICQ